MNINLKANMLKKTFLFSILCVIMFSTTHSYSQISIVEIKAVYKSKVDGRIIPDKEFQSYKGTHTYHELIKGKKGKDTIIISPPDDKLLDKLSGDFKTYTSQVGKPMKAFNVTDIYGNSYNSNQLKGKVLVFNFWFVACPPCIKEIPDLNDIVQDYSSNSNIVFIAFAKDTESLLGKFLGHTEFNYGIIPNSTSEANKYSVNAYPSNMVIDKKGIIRYASVGLEKNSITKLKYYIKQALK